MPDGSWRRLSSTLIIGVILFLTAIIAGLEKKYICQMILIGVAGASLIFGTYYISGGKLFTRVGTVISRLENRDPLKELHATKQGTLEFQNILDDNMQEISAKIAISEGGLFGKGPGNSTQRYVVAVMYEDYMYAFIVEEYGLLFSIFIMILYGSLIAGSCHSAILRQPLCEDTDCRTDSSDIRPGAFPYACQR